MAVLAGLQQALQMGGGKVSMSEVRKAVNEELSKRKISKDDLGKDLLAYLDSNRKVTLTIGKLLGVSSTKEVSGAALNRPLTQLILKPPLYNSASRFSASGCGAVSVIVCVVSQPLASVTVKVYVPAHSAVISSSIDTKLLGQIQL
jgi:hypothetical protein